jgi:hypothetical protein
MTEIPTKEIYKKSGKTDSEITEDLQLRKEVVLGSPGGHVIDEELMEGLPQHIKSEKEM